MRRQGQTLLKRALGRDETSWTRKFHLDIGKTYFWFVCCTTSLVNYWNRCLNRLWKIHPWGIQNLATCRPEQPAITKIYLDQKLGLDNLYSPSQETWFQDTSASASYSSCTTPRHGGTRPDTTLWGTHSPILPEDFPMGTQQLGGLNRKCTQRRELEGPRIPAIL